MKKVIKNLYVLCLAEGNKEMPYPEAKNITFTVILLLFIALFVFAGHYREPVNHGSLFDPAISSQDLNTR